MLTYLGLWILISSVATDINTRTYWYNSDPSPFKGAPFILHIFISFARFDAIKNLYLSLITLPFYIEINVGRFDKLFMLGTGTCQVCSFLDGYLFLTNKCQYVHQGGRVQDLGSSYVNLIQSGINTIRLRIDYVDLFWYGNSQREG